MTIIGTYPYPNTGISLLMDEKGEYWHKGHGQLRKLTRAKALKYITTFFKQAL